MSSDSPQGALGLQADGELIELAQNGSRAAFETLFHRHQNRVYTLALGITGNPTDAKDVVQDTFVKTYARISRLKKDGPVLAYLLKTASNNAIDMIRRRRVARVAHAEMHTLPGPSHASPDTVAESAAAADYIIEALLELPDNHRIPLVLHHIESLPLEEIAKKLKIPEGTVKSRLGRAREALRRKLAGRVL